MLVFIKTYICSDGYKGQAYNEPKTKAPLMKAKKKLEGERSTPQIAGHYTRPACRCPCLVLGGQRGWHQSVIGGRSIGWIGYLAKFENFRNSLGHMLFWLPWLGEWCALKSRSFLAPEGYKRASLLSKADINTSSSPYLNLLTSTANHLSSLTTNLSFGQGETLYLYLGVVAGAVSSVLLREEGSEQKPIYYVSRALHKAELRYIPLENRGFLKSKQHT